MSISLRLEDPPANGKLKTTGSHHFSSLNEGVQAVLYKDKGKREELKNYRPITMLNACYKVLATAMTIRTGAVIESHRDFGKNEKELSDRHTTAGKSARKMERTEMSEVLKNND